VREPDRALAPADSGADLEAGAGRGAFALGLVLAAALAGAHPQPPLVVVSDVELERYLGRWYEIASIPQRFQRGCVASRATYTPDPMAGSAC
jgi:lipocalin